MQFTLDPKFNNISIVLLFSYNNILYCLHYKRNITAAVPCYQNMLLPGTDSGNRKIVSIFLCTTQQNNYSSWYHQKPFKSYSASSIKKTQRFDGKTTGRKEGSEHRIRRCGFLGLRGIAVADEHKPSGERQVFFQSFPARFWRWGAVCVTEVLPEQDTSFLRQTQLQPPQDQPPSGGGEAALSSASRAARWWKRKPQTTQITLDRQAFFISAAFIFKNPPGKRLLPNKAGASLHVIALKADVTKPARH